MLRTTDGGSHYDKEGYDKVNADTISTSTSAAVVSYGLKQLDSLFSSIRGGSMSSDVIGETRNGTSAREKQ